jgi:hypothetical protein
MSTGLPEEAVDDIEKYAHEFLRFIGELHDKYIPIISENEFMQIALDYLCEAEKRSVYSNEGFISAVISMEALFNDGPTDIRYKVSHRAAFLLGLCEIDPIEASGKLKSFYDQRSILVHGGGSLSYDPDDTWYQNTQGNPLSCFRCFSKMKKDEELVRGTERQVY